MTTLSRVYRAVFAVDRRHGQPIGLTFRGLRGNEGQADDK